MKKDSIPNGWTDDLSIELIGELDFDTFIEEVLNRFRSYEDFTKIHNELIVPNVLESDRNLVLDRAVGGIVRALTGAKANIPDKNKDPIAYKTFMEVWNTFEFKCLPIFKWRKVGGFWKEWNEWRLATYS